MTGEQCGCGLGDEVGEDDLEVVHVVADRKRAPAEGPHREFCRVQDRVTVGSGRRPAACAGETGFGDVTELFPQQIGAGEAEMTDLVQTPGPGLRPERCATNNARIASTLPSPCFAMPDARPDSAARAASIASTGSDLPCIRRTWRFGAINLDHHETPRSQIARQARAIRAGALDTNLRDRTKRAQPVVQLDEPGRRRRERLDARAHHHSRRAQPRHACRGACRLHP